MTTTNETPLRRVSTLPHQKLNDEVLVVDPRTREVHLLNPTATRIWDLLETPHTPDELVAILTAEFDASPEQLRADLDALLGELASKGLVGSDPETESARPTGSAARRTKPS